MDLARFGLRTRPFRSTPDTDFYYPSTTHELALNELRVALEEDEGLALLTSESGLGKTLIAHRLLETLLAEHRSILLTHTHFLSRSDLLQAILFDLGLPFEHRTEQELRLRLIGNCLDYFSSGGRTLLIVDEAQNLNVDQLEELRLLTNLEGKYGKAIQIVLIGHSSWAKQFKSIAPAFYHRLSVRAVLEPMDQEESMDYVRHQVRMAGGDCDRLFTAEALDEVAVSGKGFPRRLNQICGSALHLAQSMELDQIDLEATLEAVNRLGFLEAEADPTEEEPLMSDEGDRSELPQVLVYGSDPPPIRSGSGKGM